MTNATPIARQRKTRSLRPAWITTTKVQRKPTEYVQVNEPHDFIKFCAAHPISALILVEDVKFKLHVPAAKHMLQHIPALGKLIEIKTM